MPVGDMVDQPPHATRAPELIDPSRWGLSDDEPTVASDIFAFATVVWEVSTKLAAPYRMLRCIFSLRFSVGNLRTPTGAFSQENIQW
jgi:hypothetical protein